MSKRRRRPEEPLYHPGKPLTLIEIKFKTCEILQFLYDLCCLFCKPKISAVENTRKPRKSFRAKLDQNRCDQFWDEKWANNENATNGQIKHHIDTRKYLRINVEATLEEIGYEHHRRRKIPSSASPASPFDCVLTATGGFESAETPARASTALAEGSGIVGSRAHGSGVVAIYDHTVTTTPRQPLCAPPDVGVSTATGGFKSSVTPSGNSLTHMCSAGGVVPPVLNEACEALLGLGRSAVSAVGGVSEFLSNSSEINKNMTR